MLLRLLALLFALGLSCLGEPPNWTGPYQPCRNSAGLRSTGHLHLGIRYDLSDPLLVQQFQQAFAFWSRLLDAEFYEEPSDACAVAIVDGTRGLLGNFAVARAQLPGRGDFNGWIAVDPKANTYLSYGEAVATWTHEIGHLLGLKHSSSPKSLMYFIDVDATSELDRSDIAVLARLHALRAGSRPGNAFGLARSSNNGGNGSSRQRVALERTFSR